MQEKPNLNKKSHVRAEKTPWVIHDQRSKMFSEWVREVRHATAKDVSRRCWIFHKWTPWSALEVDGDRGLNWQTRRCVCCGKIQDERR